MRRGCMSHPKCPECNRISGLTVPNPVDKASLTVNPFDSQFDEGVMVLCLECMKTFKSMDIVKYRRAHEQFRIMWSQFAKRFLPQDSKRELGNLVIPSLSRRK
jgi:hypothetical protein